MLMPLVSREKIALRSVAQHAVLTGTPLSENDPRLLYQGCTVTTYKI